LEVDWIAADWGTSNLRVWAIRPDGSPRLVAESDLGMSRLKPSEYAGVLDKFCSKLVRSDGEAIDVVICGMAGAKQGWLEAHYLEAPATLPSLGAHAVRPQDASPRLRPRILPGICIRTPGNEDVMRGEETQLLGLTALMPDFSGTVILPGTHSKWASLDNGTLSHFATAMTGELFHALGSHTVLAQSISSSVGGAMSPEGVSSGLADGLEAPQRLTSMIFKVRAASLLSARDAEWCRGYLSGLLIGAEVGGNADWLAGQDVVPLLGSPRLVPIYLEALRLLGKEGQAVDAAQATIEGLKASYSRERT
jgi:2-dehydro-3-deoxygalactonokinase